MGKSSLQTDTINHERKRVELVSDLQNRGITDPNVLQAMKKVARHLFLSERLILPEELIYDNVAISIGDGQTISRPYVCALQAELLKINSQDKVLEIGTGTGYLAAVLSEMGASVYTTEILPSLFEQAKNRLHDLGYNGVFCYRKDGYTGLPEEAPFDKIIVTVTVAELPLELLAQLKIGGTIVLPFGDQRSCELVRLTKYGEDQFTDEVWSGFVFATIAREPAHH